MSVLLPGLPLWRRSNSYFNGNGSIRKLPTFLAEFLDHEFQRSYVLLSSSDEIHGPRKVHKYVCVLWFWILECRVKGDIVLNLTSRVEWHLLIANKVRFIWNQSPLANVQVNSQGSQQHSASQTRSVGSQKWDFINNNQTTAEPT